MPKLTVVATTALGRALEDRREALGMSRADAYRAAGLSDVQWTRLLKRESRFQPLVVGKAAAAVGLDIWEAWRLARVAFVPDDATRVMTVSEAKRVEDEVHQLRQAS